MCTISRSLALLVLSRLALSAVTPIAPGPGEVFTAGSECSISWTPDESGKWKSFSIGLLTHNFFVPESSLQEILPLDLMSGSNYNMTVVANVAEDLDGTDPSLSPYVWTCPDVDPYSSIYFYQFNAAADKTNPAWTTRFTVSISIDGSGITPEPVVQIASPAGETTAPLHSNQPNGDNIPWGIGVMRSESTVASREKHSGKGSTEGDPSENYGSDDDETSQRPGNDKVKGGTYNDDSEEAPTKGTNTRKGNSGSGGTSSEDPVDSEVSEDDEPALSTKSKSPKSNLKDDEDNSKGSDATNSKNDTTEGSDESSASTEDEESDLEDPAPTSSRMKTVHSKPTSTPFLADNVNAATPTLPLPSATLLSAQPVGCAGGTNATSSYCSAPSSASHAARLSKLDSGALLATVLLCLFRLL